MKLKSVRNEIWYDLFTLDVIYFEPELYELANDIFMGAWVQQIDDLIEIVLDNNLIVI